MAARMIDRARTGDLAGMSLAGLVRLSFETDDDEDQGDDRRPYSGRDIRGRDQQAADCRGYVEHRGGSYVYTYEEPNTSAYKRRRVMLPDGRAAYRVVRPVFDAALADLKRGRTPDGQKLDGLIVYDIDRLTRDPRHLEDAIEVVEHFGKPIIDITGTLDLLTDNGRTMARVIVAAANKSSADTARRVRRKHQAMQQKGIPAGGQRPYGWTADRRTLDEAEAARVRDVVRRILAGAPIGGMAAGLNADGVSSPSGKKWTAASIKSILRNPRICGLRGRMVEGIDPETGVSFRRIELVLNSDGSPVVGLWEPIISVAEWRAVIALLAENRKLKQGHNARKFLLSGILRCGNEGCGVKMRGGTRMISGVQSYMYSCPSSGLGGCGSVAITGPPADEYITEAVIAKFEIEAERRSATDAPDTWPSEGELAEVRDSIAELTAGWRGRKISAARYFALLPELEAEEAGLLAQRDVWHARQAALAHRPLTIRDDWYAGRLTLAEKRAYVERALAAVVVAPVEGARGIWNPDRMTPLWRTPGD